MKTNVELKTPKGMKDWSGKDMVIREKIFATITKVFKRHGGVTIDTPVVERKDILTDKYGEDSKLIYDLEDQGGEKCSLRYDLTVPFARFLAMNQNIQNIKRYQIGKVYRRDQPQASKGRLREFYQCDFDAAGVYDPLIPDAELIRIAVEVFESLGFNGKYTIKVNHRKILDGIFQVCGVPTDKLRMISSAVDKLDKAPWAEVRKEMTEQKGLEPEVADRIGEYVTLKGGKDLLERLQKDEALSANESVTAGLSDMALLFRFLKNFGVLKHDCVSFDMSLARGLDYYTGVIYEVITEGSAPQAINGSSNSKPKKKSSKGEGEDENADDPSIGIGSIAGGGRYDNLVGMFSGKQQMPCVGISFGVERIFSLVKKRLENDGRFDRIRGNDVDVFVMAFGGKGFDGMLDQRQELVTRLWDAGLTAEHSWKEKPKLPQQFKAAELNSVPFALILGEEELAAGKCKIKEMGLPEGHAEKDGVLIDLSNVEEEVLKRIGGQGSLASLAEWMEGMSLKDRGEAAKTD